MSNPALEKAYAYAAEMQSRAALSKLPRYVRRTELHQIVPLAETTIYEMEKRNEFPRRFCLTPRAPVWDLAEVEAWIKQRRLDSESGKAKSPVPTSANTNAAPSVRPNPFPLVSAAFRTLASCSHVRLYE